MFGIDTKDIATASAIAMVADTTTTFMANSSSATADSKSFDYFGCCSFSLNFLYNKTFDHK